MKLSKGSALSMIWKLDLCNPTSVLFHLTTTIYQLSTHFPNAFHWDNLDPLTHKVPCPVRVSYLWRGNDENCLARYRRLWTACSDTVVHMNGDVKTTKRQSSYLLHRSHYTFPWWMLGLAEKRTANSENGRCIIKLLVIKFDRWGSCSKD